MSRLDAPLPGLLLLPQAKSDLRETFLYLARNSEARAYAFAAAVEATFEQLAAMPHLGAPRDFAHAQLRGIRQWPVRGFKNYLIFYRPFASRNGVEIIRILHATRDLPGMLLIANADDEPPIDAPLEA